jgi:hypothetical protein
MIDPILLIGSQYTGPKAPRFARNQAEAGIAHLPWESRLKPMRPLARDIALTIGVASTIAAAAVLFS